MERNEVISVVQQRLEAVNGGLTFEIIRDGVKKESDWWIVPVIASRRGQDVPREITVNIFANIETELEDEHHLTVMFVPAVA